MGSKDEHYEEQEIELEQTPPFERLSELQRQPEGGAQEHEGGNGEELKVLGGKPSIDEAQYEVVGEQGSELQGEDRGGGEGGGEGGGGEPIANNQVEEEEVRLDGMNSGKVSIDEGLQEQLEGGIQEQKHRPYFVCLVILICTIMYLVSMAENGWQLAPLNENPMLGPNSTVLINLGAKVTQLIVQGDWWRLIAPMFLHAGLVHLLLNMITLWRLGTDLEEAFGPFRIGAIYFFSGLFGILMSAIFLPEIPGVGASGAICGLLGAKLSDFFHYHKYLQEGKWKYLVSLVLSTIVSLAMGLFPMLDNFAHVGGWICGVLSGTVFLAYAVKDPLSGRQRLKSVAVLVCLAIQISLFIAAFIVLYSQINGNSWCTWCHNLSCIQGIPWWDCSKQYCRTVTRRYANGTVVHDCEPV